MIKTVILDLGNVVVAVDTSRRDAQFDRICNDSGRDAARRLQTSGLPRRFDLGQLSPEEFHGEMCRELGMSASYQQFCAIWTDIFLPETLIPDAVIADLHRKYRLLLLSNTDPIHFRFIRENYRILSHFDSYVLSFELGAAKPSPLIYQEAVRRAGCAPGDCFFVDDVAENVEAARREGLQAAQFQSLAQFQEELRARGIV